jgi:NAD(P)-dependent dehydrogenase (short-subunit alcohol dehydrogenase family)
VIVKHRLDLGQHREPAAVPAGVQRVKGGGAPADPVAGGGVGALRGAGQRVGARYIKTEMAPVDDPKFRRHWIEDAPMQRYGMPAELGPSVVFLASAASRFMTGEVLVIDGGYSLY